MVAEWGARSGVVYGRGVELRGRYRELVQKGTTGEPLDTMEADEAARLLRELGLPAWCYRRDVLAAVVMKDATTDYRRRELLWLYPHLFAEARQWAQLRRDERAARRRAMAQLRRAGVLPK